MNILVLDVGTSSMRGLLMDEGAQVLSSVRVSYGPVFCADGRVEQDPADWVRALEQICRETAAEFAVDGVALTSQRSSLIPVDREGTPLRRAIMWQDTRNEALCAVLSKENDRVFSLCGFRINTVYSGGKMAWYRKNQPELYARTHKLLTVADYLVFQLTGEFCSDHTYGSRSLLMNLRERRWDGQLLALFGVDEDKLCRLVPPGTVIGSVYAGFAARSGLRAGVPVVSCGGDQQCGALGQGVFRPGCAAVNAGTGVYLVSSVEEVPEGLKPDVVCGAAAAAGSYLLESSVLTCCSALDWFLNNFYGGLDYSVVDRELEQSPAGAGGVVCLPYFQGRSAPDWNGGARGMFHGLSLSTTRADLLRALLEGICGEIGGHMARMERYMPIKAVFASGGLTKSAGLNQLQADVYGKPVRRCDGAEATARGAWMNAAVALGVCGGLEQAWNVLGHEEQVFLPNKAVGEQYGLLREKMERLYAGTM